MEKNKYKIGDPKKFIISITIIVIILFVLTILVTSLLTKKDFVPSNKNSKTQTIFSKKKILSEYNKEGSKDEFVNLAIEMQEKISMWLLSNVTEDKNSFEQRVEETNKELKKHQYEKFNINPIKVDYWIGDFSLDKTGKLTFKFATDSIKPKWVTDNDIKDIII